MKKRLLRNLRADASNKALALGFVALLGANEAFAVEGLNMVSSSNRAVALSGITYAGGANLFAPEGETDADAEAEKAAIKAVQARIDEVYGVWDTTSKAITTTYYASNKDVYEAFQAVLNGMSQKIETAKNSLAEHTATGDVAEKQTEIIALLPSSDDISALVGQASGAAAVYTRLDFASYETSIKAASDSVAKLTYVEWAKEYVDNKVGGDEGELAKVKTFVRENVLDLTENENEAQTMLDAIGKYNETDKTFSGMLGNIYLRATDENTILAQIDTVTNKLITAALKDVESELDADQKTACTTEITSLKTVSDNLKKLIDEDIKKDENRMEEYVSKLADWKVKNDGIKSSFETAWTAVNKKVAEDQKAKLAEVQKSWSSAYYEISAKYENEPSVQKEYQDKFAEIQVALDKITKNIENYLTNDSVVAYNKAILEDITSKGDEVSDLVKAASEAQDNAIIETNDKNFKTFEGYYQSLNTEYLEHIQKMQDYESLAELAENSTVKEQIYSTRLKLFPYLEKINTLKTEANTAYEAANKAPYSYYDVEADTLKAITISDEMTALRKEASAAINGVAYENARKYIEDKLEKVKDGNSYYSENEWVQKAIDLLIAEYLVPVKNKLEACKTEITVADNLTDLKAKADLIDAEAEKVNAEGEAQNEVSKELADLSVYWTTAWGNKTADTEAALTEINGEITELNTKYEKLLGKVLENKETLLDEANALYNKVYKYAEPEAYAKNEAANGNLTKLFGEIETLLTDTRTAINGYSEGVKDTYMPDVDGVEETLNTLKSEVAELYDNRELAESESTKTNEANALKSALEDIAAKAAAAEEEAKKLEGDVNGDDKVTGADADAIWDVMTGVETDEKVIAGADVNGDGKVDVLDVRRVLNILANQ